jgi:P-type conjugative transfer protein TrbJ
MRKRVTVAMLMLVLLVDRPNKAEAGAFATEFTQILNHGQLVMEYIRQGQELANALDMYREQIRNGLALPSHFFGAIQADLTSLAGIVQGGRALAYSLANLDSQFRSTFTGYGTNSNVYFTKYRDWSTAALDTIRGTLRAAGLQGSQHASEQAVLPSASNDSIRQWLGQHRSVAAEIESMCAAVRGNAPASWGDTTEGRLCAAAHQLAFTTTPPGGVKSDGRTFRPGTH